ncbi:hypothetical protein FRB96_002489 [Tulasnella sp. 330]|nr:hypothetical protein FRB96_002489 [Tulasnella sp. 330]KAG8877100.1 hypothetical protein FRB98_006904 [Tulasnella sp. 332]
MIAIITFLQRKSDEDLSEGNLWNNIGWLAGLSPKSDLAWMISKGVGSPALGTPMPQRYPSQPNAISTRYMNTKLGFSVVIQLGQEMAWGTCVQIKYLESLVTCVKYSPDDNHLASGSDDKTVRVWDIQKGAEVATFKGHSDRLASGSHDKTIPV